MYLDNTVDGVTILELWVKHTKIFSTIIAAISFELYRMLNTKPLCRLQTHAFTFIQYDEIEFDTSRECATIHTRETYGLCIEHNLIQFLIYLPPISAIPT